VGTAELASAVSNAGGLGIITALTQPNPEALRTEIKRCRGLTSHPFGVNLTILPSIVPYPYDEYANVIIEEGVKIVETAGNNPQKYVPRFKEAGITVIHKCTSLRHCVTAQKLGVDIVSVDGFECAGHPGEDDIPLFILLPRVASIIRVPIVASGGIGDGRGLAAALSLGADGVNMGTRFLATREAPVHENLKRALVGSDERDTLLVFRTLHNTARVFKNEISNKVKEIEKKAMKTEKGAPDFETELKGLVSGQKGKEAMQNGNIQHGIWTAGMVMGIIDDIPSCEELINRMVDQARNIIENKLRPSFVQPNKL